MKVWELPISIDHLKPSFKVFRSITDIPFEKRPVLQVKADGEFNLITAEYSLNRWGTARSDYPAFNEISERLKGTDVKLLAELYAVEDNKPCKLPTFIHYIKSKNPADHEKIRIGVWDVLDMPNLSWIRRIALAEELLDGCQYAHVLPYFIVDNLMSARKIWEQFVDLIGYEGLVIRFNESIYKLKPFAEVDAMVLAYNKEKSLAEGEVSSLHIALMREDGTFIEIGDVASGLKSVEKKLLFSTIEFTRISEDASKIWVKPGIILTVRCTEFMRSVKNKVYRFKGDGYEVIGTESFYRLRHPRVMAFRPDKTVSPKDLSINQIPEGV